MFFLYKTNKQKKKEAKITIILEKKLQKGIAKIIFLKSIRDQNA
jgi:hypothetical protein